MYYRNIQAALLVYDIQNQYSFLRAKALVEQLQSHVSFVNYDFPIKKLISKR